MSSRPMASTARATAEVPLSSERVAGLCALLAGAAGFLYAVAFVVLRSDALSALFLLLGGLFATMPLTALYSRLRETDATLALWAVLLAVIGTLGAVVHGGYDLANAIHPPVALSVGPNPIDPRGLLTFGVTGLGLGAIAWLLGRTPGFPRGLSQLGDALAVLLVPLYLSRLLILDAKNPLVVVLALLSGFLANPAWYVWLGLVLWRGRSG